MFTLAACNNTTLSDPAIQIIAQIFKKNASPRLAELFYKVSTKNPEFSILKLVVHNLNKFRETSTNISFEQLSALATMSNQEKSADLLSQLQSKTGQSLDMNQTRNILNQQRHYLSLLNRFFTNRYLLKFLLEDKAYQTELATMLEKGSDLERFVALLSLNGIVLSSVTKSNMKPLDESNPKLISAMKNSANKVQDQIYKNHVIVMERYIDSMDEKNIVLALHTPNQTNLIGSAIVSFIAHLHFKNQVGIPVAQSLLRASTLFAFCIYISTYQKSLTLSLLDQFHKNNHQLSNSEYNKAYNKMDDKKILTEVALYLLTYSVVKSWFIFAPLILFK